jgi:hypothetical protein
MLRIPEEVTVTEEVYFHIWLCVHAFIAFAYQFNIKGYQLTQTSR